jgi:hypothetical protein
MLSSKESETFKYISSDVRPFCCCLEGKYFFVQNVQVISSDDVMLLTKRWGNTLAIVSHMI